MELTTERLELRFPTVEDAEAVFAAYATDPEVTRYMTWRPHESIEVTREFLSGREVANAAGKDLVWMARAGDQLVGSVALEHHRTPRLSRLRCRETSMGPGIRHGDGRRHC